MCTSQHYPLSLYWSCVLIEHQLSFFLPPICSSLYKDLNLIRLVPSLSMYPLSQLNILINLVFVSKTWSWWKPAEIPLITVVPLIFPLGRFSFSGYSRTALFLSAPTYNLLFSAPFPTTNSFLVLWYMHRNDFCSIFLQNAHRWVFFFFFYSTFYSSSLPEIGYYVYSMGLYYFCVFVFHDMGWITLVSGIVFISQISGRNKSQNFLYWSTKLVAL